MISLIKYGNDVSYGAPEYKFSPTLKEQAAIELYLFKVDIELRHARLGGEITENLLLLACSIHVYSPSLVRLQCLLLALYRMVLPVLILATEDKHEECSVVINVLNIRQRRHWVISNCQLTDINTVYDLT